MKRAALILAGGAGTRLRPLSSDENPKQFLKIFNGESLLQRTAARVRDAADSVYISTNEAYEDKCRDQVPQATVLTEPARRNTGPAIALSTFEIEAREGDCVVAALASDHFIADENEFRNVLARAYDFAERSNFLVVIAIAATEPNTAFGYLQLGAQLEPGILRVERFTEKPSLEVAEDFVRRGNYAWNASMFVWRARVFRSALKIAAPDIAAVTRDAYASMPSISIDYALMEKAPRVAAVRGDFGWSDVGSFEALRAAGVDVDALLESS